MVTKATVGQTLDYFRAQLGVHEDPSESNCQKYSHFFSQPCQAWCADCVCYVLEHCHVLDVPRSSYTPTLASGYQRVGRWHNGNPLPGDVVFFNFIGRISHVGMVEAVRDNSPLSVVTLEGNTDSAGGRTGGRVMRHVRQSRIVGFGRPSYAAGAGHKPAAKHPQTHPGQAPMWFHRLLKNTGKPGHYLEGTDVKHVQMVIGARVDSEYGPKTAARVKAWQAAHNVRPFDGEVGRITATAMG
jgi:peptidoglycan hydrolase-like protein with peptidoglycan-binding domain